MSLAAPLGGLDTGGSPAAVATPAVESHYRLKPRPHPRPPPPPADVPPPDTLPDKPPVQPAGPGLYVSASAGSDANPGTASQPLHTIQRAANLVTPGMTVYVAPGIYQENITSRTSGTASKRIRYVSVEKGKAIIRPAGASTMWSVDGGYTDIDGFQIDGSGGSRVRVGLYLNGGNSSAQNNLLHDIAQESGCDNSGGGAIVADQGRGKAYGNYDFIGNVVHHVGGGCGWIQGLYHSSSGKIMNNVVYASSYAINLGHDDHDILVSHNTLFNNSGYGVYFGGCAEAYNNGCPTSGIQIHNNIIYGNRTGGIQGPVASEDVGNSVSFNLVYGNGRDYDLAPPSRATAETGTIHADPQFVLYRADGGGDYHVKSTSPALGKGRPEYAPAVDIEGKPRGASVTMGAYQ